MKRSDVKAVITTSWNPNTNPGAKFYPGDRARVSGLGGWMTLKRFAQTYGKKLADNTGREGTIWAATCGPDGMLRSRKTTWYGRCYTRYYIEFEDGTTMGIHSHHLTKI